MSNDQPTESRQQAMKSRRLAAIAALVLLALSVVALVITSSRVFPAVCSWRR